MKKSVLFFSLIFILLLSFFVVPPSAIGDVGDFNDYDDSDSDWGSSDWDDDDDYDYDDDYDNDYDNDYDDDDDDDYHYTSDGSGSRESRGFSFLELLLIGFGGLAFIVTVLYKLQQFGELVLRFIRPIIRSLRKMMRSGESKPKPMATPAAQDNTYKIVPAVQNIDPRFSNDKFIAWTKDVFVTLQKAWMERKWDSVRPFEKEELYKQHEMQLQQYINNGKINVLERASFDQAYLHKYVRDKDYEYLTVFFNVQMIDYIKDEKTGQVLKGTPNKECRMKYLYTFMRKTGVLTDPAKSNHSTTNCPNCGAELKVSSAGKCEYCNSIITTGAFDWVLSNIDGVKPQTVIDNSGVIIRD